MVLFLTALRPKLKTYIIYSHTELCGVQSPVYGQATGTTAWNPRPGKEEDVEVATAKFTLLEGSVLRILRSLMLAALLRLSQTFATHCGSRYIFRSGKDTARSLQGSPHHSSS